MGPGTLLLVVALIWIAMLVGLLRLVARMERAEREVLQLDTQIRSAQGHRRG
jgi:hypothetical protein